LPKGLGTERVRLIGSKDHPTSAITLQWAMYHENASGSHSDFQHTVRQPPANR
jgi:hypothetical protein